MLRRFRQVAGVVSVSLLAAACAFETARDVVAPTESGGDLSSAAAVGVWTSNSFAPDPSSCGNFEWKITNQTPTSMAGDFRASCMNGAVEITGSASGTHQRLDRADERQRPGHRRRTSPVPSRSPGPATFSTRTRCGWTTRARRVWVPCPAARFSGGTRPSRRHRRPHPRRHPPPPDAPTRITCWTGPATEARAQQVVNNTAAEFPYNTAPHHDVGLKTATDRRAPAADDLAPPGGRIPGGPSAESVGRDLGRQADDRDQRLVDGGRYLHELRRAAASTDSASICSRTGLTPPNHVPDGGIRQPD